MISQHLFFIQVRYFFTTNGTSGISSVQVQFVFRDITQTSLPLAQSFSVAYNTVSLQFQLRMIFLFLLIVMSTN